MGMSNGGAAPGGTLGVGGFDFDDASKSPLRPITFAETHSMASPTLAVATVRSEVVQVEVPEVPVRL